MFIRSGAISGRKGWGMGVTGEGGYAIACAKEPLSGGGTGSESVE